MFFNQCFLFLFLGKSRTHFQLQFELEAMLHQEEVWNMTYSLLLITE